MILDLYAVLKLHAQRYPLMQPEDALKLVYQNEYGPGHLLHDRDAALARLTEELRTLPDRQEDLPYETLGNGMVRLHLRALGTLHLTPADVVEMMQKTAGSVTGSDEEMQLKLSLLRAVTVTGAFDFSVPELEVCLNAWEAEGRTCPAHSVRYRKAYVPAYRVVNGDFVEIQKAEEEF